LVGNIAKAYHQIWLRRKELGRRSVCKKGLLIHGFIDKTAVGMETFQ